MAISWGNTTDIHQGIDRVALRVFDDASKKYGYPIAWNGVTAINESPSGAEATKLYADNKNFGSLNSKEEFGLTLECYCTPSKFDECDGSAPIGTHGFSVGMQQRKKFALIYREFVDDGNRANDDKGIYHVVIGCKASPSARDHATINDSPEAATLSYEISTTTEKVKFSNSITKDEVVHFVIDNQNSSRKALIKQLYCNNETPAETDFVGVEWSVDANNALDLSGLYTAANTADPT